MAEKYKVHFEDENVDVDVLLGRKLPCLEFIFLQILFFNDRFSFKLCFLYQSREIYFWY